jgi:K+-sensing histidine kinase KdpD
LKPAASSAKAIQIALEVVVGAATTALATSLVWGFLDHRLEDIVMVFLFGIVSTAVRFGYTASLTATACSILALDFFFTAPYLSFAVADQRHYLTFIIMAAIALLISAQTRRARREAATRESLALDRARLAEEAHAANIEAREESLRSALLSSISHDLRTPLAVIQGSATALLDDQREPLRGRALDGLQLIVSEAKRLTRLIRNLMDMTSLQSGTLRVRKDWHSLEEVVGAALARLDDQLEDRRVSVRVAPDASIVALDPVLIEQVIVNLVENAIKYTPPATPIEIGAQRTADGVVGEVIDSGPGIPAGAVESIFDPFHRASAAGVGMGLGLTICRGILLAHDGRIWAGNRAEGGAFFRFLLPGAQPRPLPVEPLSDPASTAAPVQKLGSGTE